MVYHSSFCAYNVSIIICIFSMSMCLGVETNQTNKNIIGFTVDLIHIDSPQSPFYDASLLPSQHLENALRRSSNRIHHFKDDFSMKYPQTDIVNVHGSYLIKYSIGTPPIPSIGLLDTGSDLMWTQCQPCVKCFNQSSPLFNPKTSYTFSRVPCNSITCNEYEGTTCVKSWRNCFYSESYRDGSFTKGALCRETITLGSTDGQRVSFPFFTFGCGLNNDGTFFGGESGIIGLGSGKLSIIRQLDYKIQGKFSYCLMAPFSSASYSSKMNFGANAEVSGTGTVSTRLISKTTSNFYYITLDGVSIDGERLELYDSLTNNSMAIEEGNIIIDSGTTLTYLPKDLYDNIKESISKRMYYERMQDPRRILDLCFYTQHDIIIFPYIVFHFRGADVKLKTESTFIRSSKDALCLAFLPDDKQLPVFGNLAQTNFLVGFDLKKMMVSFKPTECNKS